MNESDDEVSLLIRHAVPQMNKDGITTHWSLPDQHIRRIFTLARLGLAWEKEHGLTEKVGAEDALADR